jgi:hypothetical protein
MKLSEYLNSINFSKSALMDDDQTGLYEKEYVPFVVNRCLSYFPDSILYANQCNQMGHLSSKMQFDYLRLSLRKRKRFSRWLKREDSDKLELIKKHFNYSNQRAREALSLLSDQEIQNIEDLQYTGGVKKR